MKIVQVFSFLLFDFQFILIAFLGGLWWLIPGNTWWGGWFLVTILWAFLLNKLPTQGLKCLEDRFNKHFLLPLAILSSVGFLIGFLVKGH